MDLSRADIRVGYLCNNNCRFCCVSDQRGFNLDTSKVKELIRSAKKYRVKKLVFTGGEPTMRKDIFQLVSYASKLNFKDILVITNGRRLSYKQFFDKLVENGLTSVCFSIPDTRREIYEHLTHVKGSFLQLMRALDNARSYNLLISTITVINKLNYKYLPEITWFLVDFKERFDKFFSEFIFINPTDNAWKYRDELVPRISDVAKYVHKSLDIARDNGLRLNVEAIPFCYMKGYENNIVELNMAKRRVFFDSGKGADFSYNENRKLMGKSKGKDCKKCSYYFLCEGIWNGYVDIYGFGELNPYTNKVKNKLLQLSIACNQKCVFCTLDKYLKLEFPNFTTKPFINYKTTKFGISTSEAKREILESDCKELTFVGGEPTLRSDLIELISFAKKNNIKMIALNTNGVKLSNNDYVKKLKKAGLDYVLLSLHSHTQQDSEIISGIKGNFKKTLKGIENSLNQKLKVNLVYVIYSKNYKQLREFVKFIHTKFPSVDMINFVFIKSNDEDLNKIRSLMPRLTEVKDYLREAIKFCEKYNIGCTVSNIPLCFIRGLEKYNMQTRELLWIKNKHPFEIWMKNRLKNNEKDEYGFKDKNCKLCSVNKYCIGLIKEYVRIYGTKELLPIKEKITLSK